MKRKLWKLHEIDYLIKHYSDIPTKDISEHLGRDIYSVYNKSYLLKLKKSQTFRKSDLSGCIKKGEVRGKDFQFKKGNKPWNKNKKGYMGANVTSFKKGMVPSNYRPVGSTRISKDGYIEVKIEDPSKWVLMHRHVWLSEGNQLPKNMNLIFLDGNKLNCKIENLALISREENMKRNTIHRYPSEVKEAIHAVKKLNKTIKNYEKQD